MLPEHQVSAASKLPIEQLMWDPVSKSRNGQFDPLPGL